MSSSFLPGIDVLLTRHLDWVRGHRVGLIAHPASVDASGWPSANRLHDNSAFKLSALFGPEHGFLGTETAGEATASRRHPAWGIPIFSLYGATRQPTPAMLKMVDTLVFDLQDIGARPYTYVSTLRNILTKAAEFGKRVVVADRPAPLPDCVDGPALDPAFESFVAAVRMPMAYGMTSGEAALWLKSDLGLQVDLKIARMHGYARETARNSNWPPWIPPSPGIRTWETAQYYLTTVFTEATPAVNCGRSSTLPFQVFGGKGWRAKELCNVLANQHLPGVRFVPHPYRLSTGPDAGTMYDGVRIVITKLKQFRPVWTSIAILHACQTLQGRRRLWKTPGTRPDFFDKLYGTDSIRKALLNGAHPAEIAAGWAKPIRQFQTTRRPCLLY